MDKVKSIIKEISEKKELPKTLLSTGISNAKTVKNNLKTFILYLAPYNQNSKNYNLCPNASKGCAAACLFTAGRGLMSPVLKGRIKKTEYFINDKKAFIIQIEWALKYELPIVIHSRNSFNEIHNILKKYKNIKGVFHCFGGSLEEAEKIIDLGLYLGIGGVLTFKNSNLHKVLENISLNNILIETDAPYLSPSPFRGKRNKPEYLDIIANKLCEIKDISKEELTNKLYLNTINLFSNEDQ